MKKYGGDLIYQAHDEFGVIEVVDYKRIIRGLHFGNNTQQSGMYLHNSVALFHPYTQAMLSVVALSIPQSVLILGIGGGSMIKFLFHHFHYTKIDAVDIRSSLIEITHEYFDLPKPNIRLNMHICDFREYLKQAVDKNRKYDLILVDLFSVDEQENISVPLDGQLRIIKSLLTNNGLLGINILSDSTSSLGCFDELASLFAGTLFEIPVDGANTVALASKLPLVAMPSELQFQYFENKYSISARKYLNNMRQCL